MLWIDWENSDFFKSANLNDFEKDVLSGTFQGSSNELMANMFLQDNRSLVAKKKLVTKAKTAARKKLELDAGAGSGPRSYVPVLAEALKRGLKIEVSTDFANIVRRILPETRDILTEMAANGLDGITIADKYGKSQNWVHDRVEGGAVKTIFHDAGYEAQIPDRVGLVLLNAAVTIADEERAKIDVLDRKIFRPFTEVEIYTPA